MNAASNQESPGFIRGEDVKTEESGVPPIRVVWELDEALEPAIAANSPVTVVANMTVRQIEAELRTGAHELRFSAMVPASGPLLYVLDTCTDQLWSEEG